MRLFGMTQLILERLMRLENASYALKKVEVDVLEQANELGLMNNSAQVSAMLGYHMPDAR
jgi:hypothetical protein